MTIYDIASEFIIPFEGIILTPYFCPANKLTIGIGEVIKREKRYGQYKGQELLNYCLPLLGTNTRTEINNKIFRHYGDIITMQEALNSFHDELKSDYWYKIRDVLPDGLTDNQCASILSFVYNVGVSAFKNSTLLKYLISGNMTGASNEFLKWDKATINGKKRRLNGLTRRRKAERELFLK